MLVLTLRRLSLLVKSSCALDFRRRHFYRSRCRTPPTRESYSAPRRLRFSGDGDWIPAVSPKEALRDVSAPWLVLRVALEFYETASGIEQPLHIVQGVRIPYALG